MSRARELAELGAAYDSGALSNRNVIINGGMKVAQRGTSSTGIGASAGYFTVDRFHLEPISTAGRLTMTQESITDLPGFANSIKLACTTADTSVAAGEGLLLQQRIEGQDLQRFEKGTSSAKGFTVSFYVKGNAAATYVCELYDNDNARAVSQTFAVTTSWNRIELTFPADTTGSFDDDSSTSLFLQFWLHAGSTFSGGTLSTTWSSVTQADRAAGISSFFDSTSRTFFMTGLQLEVGTEATPFEHRSYGEEFARCQRYYSEVAWPSYSTFATGQYTYNPGTNMGVTLLAGTPGGQMRVTPTMTYSDNSAGDFHAKDTGGGSKTLTGLTLRGYPGGGVVQMTAVSGSSFGADDVFINVDVEGARFEFDAEL